MSDEIRFRALILSAVKHDYIAKAVQDHRRFEIVGVADETEQPEWVDARNEEFALQAGVAYYKGITEAITAARPDVAIVTSQTERHCDLAIQALSAGLHVIVDKPLSNSLQECERLVQCLANRPELKCLVWNRNCFPSIQHAMQQVQEGEIGELQSVHCDFYFAKDAGPRLGSRTAADGPIDWLERQIEAHVDGSDGAVGNVPMGELQNEGLYPLAFIHRFTGGRCVERVFARATTHFHQAHADNKVDDLASVTLEMQGGVLGSICLGRIGAAGHPNLGEIKVHLVGSTGALVIQESAPEVSLYYRGQPKEEYPDIRVYNENDYLLLENFVTAIEDGGELILDAKAAAEIARVTDACLRSASDHRVVELESTTQVQRDEQ
ncbi:MAG: Gfo/Idh/MocA family oxidoreductase [Planctomycetota bacterium]